MANKQLFTNTTSAKLPKTNTVNEAGGRAYKLSSKHSLAQYAATGMFGNTYYTNAKEQLDEVLKLANDVPAEFLAQVAVYSRKQAWLKDMPALLVALLSTKDAELFQAVFPKVIDNGRMVRNFVQIMRSGVIGRKSLGSGPKRAIQKWLENQTDEYIFKQTVGNDPSLADVIRLVHPRPSTKSREALYRYILGMDLKGYRKHLPKIVKEFEKFKTSNKKSKRVVPDVPFQMLTSQDLSDKEWAEIAKNGNWQFTRMNLNTFDRHNVFMNQDIVQLIADRLKDEREVLKSRNYPYQMYTSYLATASSGIPKQVVNALQDALDISLKNVPEYDTKVNVLVDVSGSMGSRISGGYISTGPSCVDAAAIFGAAVLASNPDADIIVFNDRAKRMNLNSRDSVVTNTQKLRNELSGGTNCAAPLKLLNKEGAKGDLVVMVSDNMSWMEPTGRSSWGGSTGMMAEWSQYKKRNKNAVLVCIDITPGTTAQAVGKDVLLVGGFNDRVFDVIAGFLKTRKSRDDSFWTKEIEKISLQSN